MTTRYVTKTVTDAELAIAYHEGGHAVIALANNIGVRYATIEPDTDAGTLGHVKHAGVRDIDLDIISIMFLAGPIAEAKATGRDHQFGSEDIHFARSIISGDLLRIKHSGAVSCWNLEQRLERKHATAKASVNEHWTWIQRVARYLCVCRRLNGVQIQQLRWSSDLSY